MVQISSDAQKILSGADPRAVAYATANAPGGKLTSGEAQRLLSQFQAAGSYDGQNVLNAVSGTTPSYNYADPYGARTSIEERLGLGEATTAEQEAQAGLLGFQDTTRAQINALRANRDLSTGLEAGYEAQRTREATAQEKVLANELALAQQKRLAIESKVGQEYEIFQTERQNRENLLLSAIQAGAKNVNIGMTTEELAQAYTKAVEKSQKDAEKKAYKDNLIEQLTSIGKSTKGLSTNELENKLRKYNKSALEEEKVASTKSTVVSGGYTPQEERKLRAAGIDPTNIEAADRFLYQGISPEQERQLKLENTLATSVQQLIQEGVAPSIIQKNTLDKYGYDLGELSEAYGIDISGAKEGILSSGKGFWSNFWSGLTGK